MKTGIGRAGPHGTRVFGFAEQLSTARPRRCADAVGAAADTRGALSQVTMEPDAPPPPAATTGAEPNVAPPMAAPAEPMTIV